MCSSNSFFCSCSTVSKKVWRSLKWFSCLFSSQTICSKSHIFYSLAWERMSFLTTTMLSSIEFLHCGQRASSTVSSPRSFSFSISWSFSAISRAFAIWSFVSFKRSFCRRSFSEVSFSVVCFQQSTSYFIFCSIISSLERQDAYSLNIVSIFCRSSTLFYSQALRAEISEVQPCSFLECSRFRSFI